jgi:hypothetical protein
MPRVMYILVALMLPSCSLMTNDYSTTQKEDGGDEHDAAPVDARDEDLKDCTPIQATSAFTLLRGPSEACGNMFCNSWLEMCLTEDRRYLVLQTDGQFVRWFDRCNLLDFGSVNSTIICTAADGYTVSIGAQGRQVTDAPGGFSHTWSLYHRNITEYEFLASADGCGESECEMFSGFQLDPDHRYLVRQIDKEKVFWYDNCQLADVGTSDLDKLICAEPEEGNDIVIQASAPETTSVPVLQGNWTVFSESIDGGMHTYLTPTRGCGSAACPMWNDFDLSADHRYMVLQSNDTDVRWFDSCSGQFEDVNNKKLRCVSSDGHYIELQTQGDETSDVNIDNGYFWSLLRWSLDAS